jgi:transposase
MSKTAIEVITSVERRRRWSAAEKARLVAASLEPGRGVSAVSREAGIYPSQLYGWRRQLCRRPEAAAFAAARIAAEPSSMGAPAAGMIDIEFATGIRMRITGGVEPATLMAAVTALASGGRRR